MFPPPLFLARRLTYLTQPAIASARVRESLAHRVEDLHSTGRRLLKAEDLADLARDQLRVNLNL